MDIQAIITIVVLGIVLLGTIIGLVTALVRGEMKKFIEEKMVEAEKSGKSGAEKLAFVIEAFKEKYKIMQFVLNAKQFIEKVIELSKQINAK